MRSASVAAAGFAISHGLQGKLGAALATPLEQFEYGDVELRSPLHEQQLDHTHSVLMGLSDDSLLKPLRQMSGQPAP